MCNLLACPLKSKQKVLLLARYLRGGDNETRETDERRRSEERTRREDERRGVGERKDDETKQEGKGRRQEETRITEEYQGKPKRREETKIQPSQGEGEEPRI